MCNYFILRRESSPEVLGVKNGIKQADIKRRGFINPEKYDYLMDVLGSNNYWNVERPIAELDIELQYVEMLPRAVLTDFVQFGPYLMNCPFLISERVLAAISRFNIGNFSIFPALVVDKGQKHTYFLVHLGRFGDDIIDFSRSVFVLGNEIIGRQAYQFGSAEEKDAFEESNIGFLTPEHIFLSDSFDSSLDLFVMGDGQIIISERLEMELSRSKCHSGVKFLPAFGEDLRWVAIHPGSEPSRQDKGEDRAM